MRPLPKFDININDFPFPSYKEETLYPQLREDDEFAGMYLTECFYDENPKVFLAALQNVIHAKKINISDLCRKLGLNRSTFYKIISPQGNPSAFKLTMILGALGFDMKIEKRIEA